MARSSFLPWRIDAARLAKTSFGSLSRSCLTPRMLTPKYWEVGPGIPSLLKPRAIRGSREEISFKRALRGVIAAAVMGVCADENVVAKKCVACTFDRPNSLFEPQNARNWLVFVHDLQKYGNGATLSPCPGLAPRFLILQAPQPKTSSSLPPPTTSASSDC